MINASCGEKHFELGITSYITGKRCIARRNIELLPNDVDKGNCT
eukprot:IDg9122t1